MLLVRRNDKVAFMAGAFVFPGGRVDPADHDGPATAGFLSEPPRFPDITPAQELTYRTAAVRELAALHPLRERLATELQAQLDPKPLLTILKDSFSVPAAALWRLLAFALPLAT